MNKNLSTLTKLSICLAIAVGSNWTCFADVDEANLKGVTNAPIIESGRLVGTITNTSATLRVSVRVPGFNSAVRHKDFTVSGTVNTPHNVGPEVDQYCSEAEKAHGPTPEVKIIKVEDDMATIVPTSSKLPFLPSAVTVPIEYIKELDGLPHLTDNNPLWINSETMLESLAGVKERYIKNFPANGPAFAWRNIPWHHNTVHDEYQTLKVPITSELPYGDNSSVVAVANALNYLYTKANTNPTQVSKSFLTWAHDAYTLNDSQLTSAWSHQSHIDPKLITEGESCRILRAPNSPSGTFHPERIAIPITSGNEHIVDLGRLLKGIQRFGVALEPEQPSTGVWATPSTDTQKAAKNRIASSPIVVRCFNAWNDVNFLRTVNSQSWRDYMMEKGSYEAQFYDFVTSEIAKGHPVIITNINEASPNSGLYRKRSYLITATDQPKYMQSLQFLTPSGKFETHKYFEDKGRNYGEVLVKDTEQNSFGDLRMFSLLTTVLPQSHSPSWKDVNYTSSVRHQLRSNKYATPKFEVYSLGFE